MYLPRPVAIRVLVILAVLAIAGASYVVGCAGLTGGSVCGMQTAFEWVPLPNTATQTPRIAQSPPAAGATVALTAEPTAEQTAEPTAQSILLPPKPIVVRGQGRQRYTKPFSLPGGDFTVVIMGSGNGNVLVRLVPHGQFSLESIFNEISRGGYRYETVVYGIDAGSYYLDAIVDGSWVVTFMPLP